MSKRDSMCIAAAWILLTAICIYMLNLQSMMLIAFSISFNLSRNQQQPSAAVWLV